MKTYYIELHQWYQSWTTACSAAAFTDHQPLSSINIPSSASIEEVWDELKVVQSAAAICSQQGKRKRRRSSRYNMTDIVSRDMQTVVLDIGSGTIRAGLAGGGGECVPHSVFPSIIGQSRYNKNDKEVKIGVHAQAKRGVLQLRHPIERGIVKDWDDMERILSYIYSFKLGPRHTYNPWEFPVICTETPLNPMSNREQMTQLMFETFNVPSLSFEIPGVLSLFASGRTTGIVLDSGEGVSYAVPVREGNVILDAVFRAELAGGDSTDALENFVDRKYWLVANAKRELIRKMKEDIGYVALDYEREKISSSISGLYGLPDGNSFEIEGEDFKCAEVLFRPSMISMESQPGVHQLLHRSLMACKDEIKEVLCDNIVLSGGSTLFRGFADRISKEMTQLVYRGHVKRQIEVVAPPERHHSAWIGGSMIASSSFFHESFISRMEYDESGPNICSRKCLWIDPSQLEVVNSRSAIAAAAYETSSPQAETTSRYYYYDVFLSFRGPDTRHGFTNDLYNALKTAGIQVFRDDDELRPGDRIDVILKAIDNSRICVPVLSSTFAASSWCLREVERMVILKKDIVPIFFNVTVNDVKLETNLYADELLKHENKHGKSKVLRWSEALKEIPKLKGRSLKNKDIVEFIEQFVKEILVKLNFKPKYNIQNLVQVPDQVEGALKLLAIGYGGKRLVALQGLPGIGKTTLAKVIFNRIHSDFDCSAFLEDVRESLQGSTNLHSLREMLLRALDPTLLRDTPQIIDPNQKLKTNFKKKKVLVVLDDVNDKDQIYNLVGDSGWFGSESRIIITTRDNRVVESTKEISSYSCYAFAMEEMSSEQALELFSKYAFGKDSPPSDRKDLASEVVSAAGLLPLALESVGSFLCPKDELVWKNTINKLMEEPNHALQRKLKQSFDALEVQQQEIFVDIACFFIGEEKEYLIDMWEACGSLVAKDIEVLISLSMIKYNNKNKKGFWMNNQLRKFGMAIERQHCKDRRASTRSLKDNDALDLLNENTGKEKVEAFSLRGTRYEHLDNFSYQGFFNSKKRLQKLEWSSSNDIVDLLGSNLLTNLCLHNLVILCLQGCGVDENWQGWKEILVSGKLKVLNLTGCNNLTCMPSYLSEAVNLERLVLRYCKNLMKLPDSLGKSLVKLDFSDTGISELPWTIGQLSQLESLDLTGCYRLQVLPVSLGNLNSLVDLKLEGTSIGWLPFYIRNLKSCVVK